MSDPLIRAIALIGSWTGKRSSKKFELKDGEDALVKIFYSLRKNET